MGRALFTEGKAILSRPPPIDDQQIYIAGHGVVASGIGAEKDHPAKG